MATALASGDRERLERCLESPFPEVRLHGLRWLGERRVAGQTLRVRRLLSDADPRIRREAARALATLAEESAVADLVELLEDPDPGVQTEAAAALGAIAKRAEEAQPVRDPVGPGRVSGTGAWEGGRTDPGSQQGSAGRLPAGAHPSGSDHATSRGPALREGQALPAASGDAAGGGRSRAEPAPLGATGLEMAPGSFLLVVSGVGLLLVGVAFLGIAVGRGLGPASAGTPVPTGVFTEEEARDLLFPGNDLYSRIGRAASRARSGDTEAVADLTAHYEDLLFPSPAGSPRTSGQVGVPSGVRIPPEADDPWPGEGEDSAAGVPVASPPASPPSRPPTSSPTRPPSKAPGATPGALERRMYIEAASRYLAQGDRTRARTLFERALPPGGGRLSPEEAALAAALGIPRAR